MADIINLKRAKKQKARVAKEHEASLNRVRFGTPKAQQKVTLARSEKQRADLEAKKLDPDKPLEDEANPGCRVVLPKCGKSLKTLTPRVCGVFGFVYSWELNL